MLEWEPEELETIYEQDSDGSDIGDAHPPLTFPYLGYADDDDDDRDLLSLVDSRFLDPTCPTECLLNPEDIDFEFVYALHTFVATVEGQANATKGDTMVLLDDSNSYWWLVRVVKDSSIGKACYHDLLLTAPDAKDQDTYLRNISRHPQNGLLA